MSTADMSRETTASVDLKLEVVVLPVSDVDRAKAFYAGKLGWREDADFATGPDFRIVQMTPPGSPTSVNFGTGVTDAVPGSIDAFVLVVNDVEAARAEITARGVEISEVFHDAGGVFFHGGGRERVAGPDPERRTYSSFASFADPDGNRWILQEITMRLPGRIRPTDVGELAELLQETSIHHGRFEAATPPHNWWDWYAAYLNARLDGAAPDAADATADRYMEEAHGVVASG